MDADCKKLLRKIVKRVHPDLFNDQPEHKEANTKSLAVIIFRFQINSSGHI